MTFNFSHPSVKETLYSGGFGLERETLRVYMDGRLSQTLHPFGDDPHISRDFCENQVEIITPPTGSPREAVASLLAFHRKASEKLRSLPTGQEVLWPFSNPPAISGEDEIPIARFSGTQSDKTTYREYLARKYGKRIELSGRLPMKRKERRHGFTGTAGRRRDDLHLIFAEIP